MRGTCAAVRAGWLVLPFNNIKEGLDDVDGHWKDDSGILFGADFRQCLQVA